ncbi:MAG: zinc-ribbon and DUF3426 domain-containing protein [Gammaproteobacteria bacterium]|nr:zinc-ribbon and DUF3426 domain-containing protein [Gammaproteobacteria bacterium]
MQTRCPHCYTLFEIQEQQLRAASGQARCSHCDNIFNARKHLVDPASGGVSGAASEAPGRPPGSFSLNALFDDPNLEQQVLSSGYFLTPPPTKTGDEPTRYGTADQQSEPNRPAATTRQPVPTDRSSDFSEGLRVSEILETRDFNSTVSHSERPEPEKARQMPLRMNTAGKPTADRVSHPEPVPFTDNTVNSIRRGHPLLLALGILSLVAIAMTQFVWFSRDRLNNYPEVRELLEMVCERAGCTLPPWREPHRFDISSRSVTTHPKSDKALQITLIFSNTARFAQPYPLLQLRLFDTQEILRAQRVFHAQEYLAVHPSPTALIQPGQSVKVEMALEDPGPEITGFKIEFL